MKKISLLGITGILLLGLGLIAAYIQGKNDLFSILPISLGAVCLVGYLVFDLKNLFSFLGSKGFKYGTNSFLMSVIFLGILIFLQMIVSNKNIQFDITAEKKFTLSEQTVKILDNLQQKIDLLAFVPAQDTRAKDLLEQYKNRSGKINYEIVDPNKNPGRSKQYQVTAFNTLILVNGLKQEKITEIDEEKLTNALIKITREGQKKVYFIIGHGEKVITETNKDGLSALKDELSKQNYDVKEIFLQKVTDIPDDASLVIMPGVQKDLLPEEEKTLNKYIQNGGNILAMIDPDSSQGFRTFLAKYGIKVRNDIIVDKLSRMFGGDFLMPVVIAYGQHPITKDLRTATFFPLASSIDTLSPSNDNNISVQPIATTGNDSWGEVNKEMLRSGKASLDPDDIKGPLSIAVLSTIKINPEKGTSPEDKKEKTGKIITFSDSDFISNGNFNLQGNSDLFLNSINWLAQEEDLLAIRPKDRKNSPLILTQTQGRLVLFSNLVFLPLLVIITGIFVTTRRRFRTA